VRQLMRIRRDPLLQRAHVLHVPPLGDDLMDDRTARFIMPPLWILEAQREGLPAVVADLCLVLISLERTVAIDERVMRTSAAKEAMTPRSTTGCPDEIHRSPLSRTSSCSARFRSIRNFVSIAPRSSFFFRAFSYASSSFESAMSTISLAAPLLTMPATNIAAALSGPGSFSLVSIPLAAARA